MKSFLLNSLPYIFFGIVLSISGAFITRPGKNTYFDAMKIKYDALKRISKPKMIFVGGSNVAFGLNSASIEKKIGMPVVNFGLHGALGLKFMLDDIRPFIKKGELIILMPEYQQFFNDQFYGTEYLAHFVAEYYPEKYGKLSSFQILKLAKYFLEIYHNNIHSLLMPNHRTDLTINDGIYSIHSFNSYGDVIAHWGSSGQKIDEPDTVIEQITINKNALAAVRNFRDFVEGFGAEFVLMPPAYHEDYFEVHEQKIHEIVAELEKLSISFSGEPEDYKFESSLFFDTRYHLNKIGIDKREELLMPLLYKFRLDGLAKKSK